MAMSSPFARPHTTGEWLRSSICWTVSCLGALYFYEVLIYELLGNVLGGFATAFLCLFTIAAHILIWKRAVAGGRAIIRHDEQHHAFSWTRLAANLWLVALTLFQLACLLWPLILIGWVLISLSVEPATSSEPFFG
jgi:hypothetical protein